MSAVVILMPQWVVFSLQKTSLPYWAIRGSDGFDRQERVEEGAGALRFTGFTQGSAASAGVVGRAVGVGRWLVHQYETYASMLLERCNFS